MSIAVFRGADCGHVDARAEAIFFERSLGAAQVQTVVATPDFQELSIYKPFAGLLLRANVPVLHKNS